MYFSINAYKYVLGLQDSYRLCKDGTWKQQMDFTQYNPADDLLFPNFSSAEEWLEAAEETEINGEWASTLDRMETELFQDEFEFEIIAHRTAAPKYETFTREQLKQVLVQADNRCDCALVIDYDGRLRAVELCGQTADRLTEYPVRFETIAAGSLNGGAADEEEFFETVYMALLEAWVFHLEMGRSYFSDYASGDYTEEELHAANPYVLQYS